MKSKLADYRAYPTRSMNHCKAFPGLGRARTLPQHLLYTSDYLAKMFKGLIPLPAGIW